MDPPVLEMSSSSSSDESDTEEELSICKSLCSLSREILERIFVLLPIETLLLFQKSRKKWVRDLSRRVRAADFRMCSFANEKKITQFVCDRTHCLTEINLDNITYVKPLYLFRLVKKCHATRVLSVRYIKFTWSQIYQILQELGNLLSLSWTLVGSLQFMVSPAPFGRMERVLRKLFLDVYSTQLLIGFLRSFSHRLNGLQYLQINVCNIQKLPCSELIEQCQSLPSFSALQSLVIELPNARSISEDCYSFWIRQHCIPLLMKIRSQMEAVPQWNKLSTPVCYNGGTLLDLVDSTFNALSSASQQFIIAVDDEPACGILDQCPQNSVDVLGVSICQLTERLVESIQKAGGKRLTKLAAVTYKTDCILTDAVILDKLFQGCPNITCLNISGIHIRHHHRMSVCAAICSLKGLKKLWISICAIGFVRPNESQIISSMFQGLPCRPRFSHAEESHAAALYQAHSEFQKMVTCCKYVEMFCITGCRKCGLYTSSIVHSSINDSALEEMHKWSHLNSLRIDCTGSLLEGTFLPIMALQCSNFTTLDLVNAGCSSDHMMPRLAHGLRYLTSLKFLRIVKKYFNYSDKDFWAAITAAKNLQCLCITTTHNKSICTSTVVMGVLKLKHLVSFHLYCHLSEISPGFERRLRRVMSKQNGCERSDADVIISSVAELVDDTRHWLIEPMCPSGHCCKMSTF